MKRSQKQVRIENAQARAENPRTPEEQLAHLDMMGYRAKKERKKIEKKIAEAKEEKTNKKAEKKAKKSKKSKKS